MILQLQRWSQKLRLFLDPQEIQIIYTWNDHSFGCGPSTAILRLYFFILFPNFSISFQATHPVLPIQLPPSPWCFAIARFQPTIQIVAT